MKRWLPAPLLSASLFVLWLLLNQSVSAGHLAIGAVAALALPWLTAPLRPGARRIGRPLTLVRLVAVVALDLVRSALQVAGAIVRIRARRPQARFVLVPLDLRDVHGLAALAVITTVVPGTVWCELAPDRSVLRLHVFDGGDDDEGFVRHYKHRYERPLMEIFE